MAETTIGQSVGAERTTEIQDAYMAMTRTKRMYGGIMLVIFIALMTSGFMLADSRNAGGFWDGILNVFNFPGEVVKEASEKITLLPALMVKFFPSLIETINIAAASTLVGGLIAIVLSLLSTRGLARFPRLIGLFRRLMDIMRAIPEIVVALVLIFVLGGGPVPAMIAIALHTTGALGKLFSEINENASLKPLEGLESTGATWAQRMLLGVVPQVAPNWLSYALLRFEINIRASAILGFVGSGGIGYDLKNAFSWGQGRYDEVAAIFILLFLTIVFFDQLSSHYRNKLVGKV
ncbi:phosphonate ABC transporter, permease protein PhnE [Aquicoccus porphyridii]|uniref:Phosphonate ABC transporter, permease protein PhnE n=1 Tax=Aquicoccus porphyridii TaxID=1852029 RepID=A0A5A9Z7G0_9RHOB|nr:phosphonate ABC transporter, permease protein PhnE [Aquicoccus porphyridii]KAA0912905.1 phosphonate ABC transporter, permease protein PhnE [Aquicoccus porphyridii]RAI54356.1 phosphonate ABC transporter, permease protein PhnE [Rhodobacteraceae bacterium AsT-22]